MDHGMVNLDISHIPSKLKAPPPQLLAPHREGEEVVATLPLQMAELNSAPLIQLEQLVALHVNNRTAIVPAQKDI